MGSRRGSRRGIQRYALDAGAKWPPAAVGCGPGPRPPLRGAPRAAAPSGAQAEALAAGRGPAFCAAAVPHSPRCAALAWLGPVARARAAAASRGRSAVFGRWRPRAALACPPLSRSAACARCALRGRSLAPSAFGPALAAVRAPCSVALPALVLGPCAARGPAGGRCGPAVSVRCAAGRLRARRLPPRPPRRLRRRSSPPGAGAVLRARPAALAWRFSGFCVLRCLGLRALWLGFAPAGAHRCCAQARFVGFSPAAPRPAAPAGGSRERDAYRGFAPAQGRASRAPLAGPPAGCARPRCRFSGAVHNPKIVNRVLTSVRKRAILVLRCPLRPLGGRRKVSADGRSAAWSLTRRRFLYALSRSDTRLFSA